MRSVKGSTRLEAKKQRRREGRETGRRRPLIITESEFLARRESVERTMVVRSRQDRTQIAVLEDDVLVEHYVSRSTHQSYVGNVYLGKVQNVLPSMEAAFVDVGKGRNAVLYAGEVNFDVSGMEGQPKRIESALKAGQSLIVQVTKDPVGHKGARLTSQISLPGRYLVYVPGASMTGISRKLPDTERNRLKQILKKVMPENAGVIVRTAAEGAAEEELSRDVSRLAAQWEAIEKKSKTASAPALLYGEPDLTTRVIRDVFNEDFSNLVVAGDEEWDAVDEYVRYVAPHLADRLSRWQEDGDVFAAYRIDEQLAKALDRKVWLPSGGSLVIDKTEAMTVIDVNTGKFTGQGGNLEETVTRNNLEAAEEIVRQLRLRDVGGIVVIDFIDMVLESNRELVLRRLLECLARDRTKHQVAEVTSLGLVQMTRKRVGAGLLEAFSVPCECCNGRGVIVTLDPEADTQAASHVHARGGSGSGGSGGGNGSRGAGTGPVNPATIAARIRPDGNGQAADTADERDPDGPPEDGASEEATSAAAGAPDSQPEPARSGNSRRRRRRPAGASAAPANGAAANAEPANAEPANAEPASAATGNTEPANGAAAANGEPPNGAPANSAPANSEPANGALSNGAIPATSAAEVPATASAANASGSLSAAPVPAACRRYRRLRTGLPDRGHPVLHGPSSWMGRSLVALAVGSCPPGGPLVQASRRGVHRRAGARKGSATKESSRVYAIVRCGGRQEKVALDDLVTIDKLPGETGSSITLPALLVVDGERVISDPAEVGRYLVTADIVGDAAGPKINMIHYRNKTGYRRRLGHRQRYTQVRITAIGTETRSAKAQGGKAQSSKAHSATAQAEED